jgi:Protein of unknown function (DUF1592)/Protein of unknown function (DUF1588)/Protein of unknown function (DUF1587)/Protein of unknown function (DUF1585)/Protein of unknown function (DUF1595)
MDFWRFCPAAAIAVCCLAASSPRAAKDAPVSSAPSFEKTVQPFLSQNCYLCHNEKLLSGGLNLQAYQTEAAVARDRERWETVLHKLEAGEMPPKGAARPDAERLRAVTAWIRAEFDRLDQSTPPDPGRVTARRLNRSEYNYTVRDLLGVDFRPADDFPQDDSGYGFDNNGDVLSLSVVQMEKYLNAAETVARTAIYGPQFVKPVQILLQPPLRRRPGDPDELFFNTHPYYSVTNYDETGLNMPNTFHVTHRFPATGQYTIRITPDNGARPPGSEPLKIAAWIDGRLIYQTEIDGNLEGRTQEFSTTIIEGEHWIAIGFPHQFEGLPVAYGAKNPSTRPIPAGRGRGIGAFPPNATPEQIAAFQARRAAQQAAGGGNGGGRGAGGNGGGAAAGSGNGSARGGAVQAANANAGAGRGGAGRGGRGGADPNAPTNNDDSAPTFFTGPNGQRLARPDNMQVKYIYIGGPENPQLKPSEESVRKIYICEEHQPGCDRQIVSHLARLAYRRPVAKEEIDELMAQVERVRERGDSFQEQMVIAIEAILVSPNFLFRIEKDPPQQQPAPVARPRASRQDGAKLIQVAAKSGPASAKSVPPAPSNSGAPPAGAYALNDYELASRLSYFLWSSMPDEELLSAADAGNLRKPEVLTAQVERMLKDPKISRFVENFGGQWLQFRALESHQPDFYLYPQYDDYLKMSMLQETEMFFRNIIAEDRSILDFLDADYTFLNEYLAKFYGIPGVTGPEFRKVSLVGTPRRGVLGQASVLTATSYGNRTSVVLRGKWVLENLLNAPPPPPPPNVPDLADAKVAPDATMRARMEAHRNNAVCASCHGSMDPIGFSLENYNAIGAWREKDGKNPIDASGTLPDGRSFRGPVELAKLLEADKDAFAQCMAEKVLTYALGRGLESYDRIAVKKIAGGIAANQYHFSSVVLEIVKSMPFQMRRGAGGHS